MFISLDHFRCNILLAEHLIFVLLMTGILTAPAFADIHPVPLDKNVDSATCLECHADKANGKHVHTAVITGCTSCHEVRVNKDVTRVKLITTTPYALCFTCHADKNPAEITGRIHKPAARECLKCHDPHESDNKYQLLKPTSGATDKDNLCLSCHAIGVSVPAAGSRHAALDMGCQTCHVTHRTGERGKQEFDFHLIKATPALCIDCHDSKDAELQKAHQNQPFGTADCVRCHDPHQSDAPKLMATFMHRPFADKQCEVCHEPAKEGKVVLTQASIKALCVTCHDEKAKQIESAKVQHPGATGDCTDCHSPHASKYPGLPKTDSVNICLSCHTDQAEQGKKRYVHRPAFETGCGTCHEAHGNDNEKLLRVRDVNTLCLECHGPDAPPPVRIEEQHLAAIFDGKVRIPEDALNRVPVLPLRYNLGHPTKGHPVANAYNTKTNTKADLTCLTCHQPHSSAKPDLLVNDQEANMAFCKTCHKEGTLPLK
ncbi:MAG TPA: cytochrome c3 family protein [Candidatus Eremiobacteraceae bacterium]|nr:cytochrome c3 family protein [Candidatus Eremiobacteraceae bacterium]